MSIITNILLVVIACLLVALLRKQWNNNVEAEVNLANVDEAVDRINRGVEHHVDVNAVVGMIKALDDHPGAVEQLQEYPEVVRAAAWLHYINTLGSDLQMAQKNLSDAHRAYRSATSPTVNAAQADVDSIRAKLDKAIAASGQKIGPRAV